MMGLEEWRWNSSNGWLVNDLPAVRGKQMVGFSTGVGVEGEMEQKEKQPNLQNRRQDPHQ